MSAADFRQHETGEDGRGSMPAACAVGFSAAIAEAASFAGATAPNPPVGCTILDADGRILVTAAHRRAGTPHAEAAALQRLAEAGSTDRAATLLVTLEPCNHRGRTGPCTEAILASPIREVWIGAADPNPHVQGGGAERLRAAGVSVHWLARLDDPEARALAADCAALIAPFRRLTRDGVPWVTVKQALDERASMVPPPGARTFTSPESLRLAHRLRRCTDAIVTGTGTILADDPGFTVRHLPDHDDRRPRLLAIVGQVERLPPAYLAAAAARGFDVRPIPSLDRLLPTLAEAGVLWAMVEAGPGLLASLRDAGLWDDWLRIEHPASGPDRLSVALSKHAGEASGLSPLSLLPELSGIHIEQEAACSPAS